MLFCQHLMGQALSWFFSLPVSGALRTSGSCSSAGCTEEELCHNLHRRSPEEQHRILQRAREQREAAKIPLRTVAAALHPQQHSRPGDIHPLCQVCLLVILEVWQRQPCDACANINHQACMALCAKAEPCIGLFCPGRCQVEHQCVQGTWVAQRQPAWRARSDRRLRHSTDLSLTQGLSTTVHDCSLPVSGAGVESSLCALDPYWPQSDCWGLRAALAFWIPTGLRGIAGV